MARFHGRIRTLLAAGLVLGLAAPAATKEDKQVCVEVLLQEVEEENEANELNKVVKDVEKVLKRRRARRSGNSVLPLGQNPVGYLKRLIEHFVTHQNGFVAVQDGCSERLDVELYPLRDGWTAFARYSGHGREERVDRLFPDELSAFAERSVLALLRDRPISTTIKRDNVLRSDSLKSKQTVKGGNHFVLHLGTRPRFGDFVTSVDIEGGFENRDQIRPVWPVGVSLGYLGKYESWGLEALAAIDIGTSKIASDDSPDPGGHVDFGGDAGLALHFLYYFDPRGLTSFYLGAGSTFELIWFSAVKPVSPSTGERDKDPRSTILGGGLNIDLLIGYEFMRANTAQFRLQAGIHLPAFMIDNEDEFGNGVHTWFPAVSVGLGVMF